LCSADSFSICKHLVKPGVGTKGINEYSGSSAG
jgi:hypothetical protein